VASGSSPIVAGKRAWSPTCAGPFSTATKRERLEAIQSAAVPGGGPTFSTGVQALMQIARDGAFRKA